MSYQVLARKWRPQSFQQVIGQPHVITALENALSQNKVHHAYLFSGTRGVGKTSIARLLAKSLNCETGVTATPCGQCQHCQAIDQGRFVDVLEIDAASRTKVDDTRELLDNVQYKPAQGRYKVYLIDEVHMLSKHSFNALLKTLEEPPEYVKFLLATTDPQKLPITVLSRCLQFHLKAILPEQIEHQLTAVLSHEQAVFDNSAINVIAKAADGSMRDALSLTDQALAFGAGHIQYNAVLKMLGTIDQSHLYYLLHFIASGNAQKVFSKIQEFVQLGADFAALHQELASLCHQIALQQLQVNANVTDKTPIQLLAERLTPEEVQLYYQIALEGYKDYRYAPNGKVALEMTVMRLLAFKPANYIDLDDSELEKQVNLVKLESERSLENTGTMVNTVQSIMVDEVTSQAIDTNIEQAAWHGESANEFAPQVNTRPEEVAENAMVLTQQVYQPEEAMIVANEAPHQVPKADSNMIQKVEQEPSEQAEPANEVLIDPTVAVTQSRNMLRSHRLKREALKKTVAAADQIVSDDTQFAASYIVNNQTVVVEKGLNPLIPSVSDSKHQATKHIESNVTTGTVYVDKSTASEMPEAFPSNKVEKAEQRELPPLSSYQEQDQRFSETANFNSPHMFTEQVQQQDPVNINEEVHLHGATHSELSIAQEQDQVGQVALETDGNIIDVEIDVASYVDDKINDPWFLDIKAMQLVGFEKLLAKSAVMQINDNKILLTLHTPQQHLLNNQQLVDSVQQKLRSFYGSQHEVSIVAGELPELNTPVKLEQIVYQQYLENAKVSLKEDPIVKALVRDYSAKVYENSVVPL